MIEKCPWLEFLPLTALPVFKVHYLELDEAQLGRLRERHAREGWRQRLRVHLAARALQVVVLPLQRVRTLQRRRQL